jgi:hypothetical protein
VGWKNFDQWVNESTFAEVGVDMIREWWNVVRWRQRQ